MAEEQGPLDQFATNARNGWSVLVKATRCIPRKQIEKSAKPLAEAAGVSVQGMLEKMFAIRFALDSGRTDEYIIGAGQGRIISEYREAKRARRLELDPQVTMSWRVSGDLHYHVRKEFARIAKILGVRASDAETIWTFMHAAMSSWTAQQIRHEAGEPRLPRHVERNQKEERQVEHAPETE